MADQPHAPVSGPAARPRVALVTDSTATLDPNLAGERGIIVVPITVAIDDETFDETDDPHGVRMTAALQAHHRVTTSRPAPERFRNAFRAAADAGAEAVVCVTLSRELSATWESAEMAARASAIPVTVVDSRTVAMGVGYAVLRGAEVAARGAGVEEVAAAVREVAGRISVLFCVDSLDHLRRGGRIGGAAALAGRALQVKPLLEIVDGEVTPLERVRTSARALDRLGDVAVVRAAALLGMGIEWADIAVQHLGAAERADVVAHRLREVIPAARVVIRPVGASLAVHAGPGLVAVVIAPGPAVPTPP